MTSTFSILHQRGGGVTGEVGLTARLVREGVVDGERRRPHADREPDGRRRLVLEERKGSAEEGLDVLLLPGFRFQSLEQRHFEHVLPSRKGLVLQRRAI
jgi:hypothetical protein